MLSGLHGDRTSSVGQTKGEGLFVKDIGTGLYAVTKLTTSPETILDMVK